MTEQSGNHMSDRVYTHFVAAVNWSVLTLTFATGYFLFEGTYLPYMLMTALIAVAIGNLFIYLNSEYVSPSDVEKVNNDD